MEQTFCGGKKKEKVQECPLAWRTPQHVSKSMHIVMGRWMGGFKFFYVESMCNKYKIGIYELVVVLAYLNPMCTWSILGLIVEANSLKS